MRNTLLLLFLLLLGRLSAQNLILTCRTDSLSHSTAVTRVYAYCKGPDSLGLRAINFSLAYNSSCAAPEAVTSPLSSNWTQLLERSFEKQDQELTYGDHNYDKVIYYGIADPGMPATRPLMLPPDSAAAVLILEATFRGACADAVYAEDEKENPVNQQGDLQYVPLKYVLRRQP